jgi:hypothetical protein
MPGIECQFAVGDSVEKTGGDYSFEGVVVSTFQKKSGKIRRVVEDGRGILHIFSEGNLRRKDLPS